MANKMLIDATHPEETRVVVLRGNRVEEFDFESANRKQLRGNIYLAKVTRVEPSLQAAFVEYGGNRHGFLAFSEIHPDYYQIPVADRQALIDEEERAQREADDEADNYARRRGRGSSRPPGAHRQRAGARRARPISRRRSAATTTMHHDHESRTITSHEHDDSHAMAAGGEVTVPPAADHDAPTRSTPPRSTPAEALAVTAAAETPIDLDRLQASSADDPARPTAGER